MHACMHAYISDSFWRVSTRAARSADAIAVHGEVSVGVMKWLELLSKFYKRMRRCKTDMSTVVIVSPSSGSLARIQRPYRTQRNALCVDDALKIPLK